MTAAYPGADPSDGRATLGAGSLPVVTVRSTLEGEVTRLEKRLDAARLDLRRWRLSHDDDLRERRRG